MSRPPDDYPLQKSLNVSKKIPSIKIGYMIVVLSVLFFLIVGYMTFFSAFIPPPCNFVRDQVNTLSCFISSDCEKGFESCGRRHPLQVPSTVSDSHLLLLRHRELGGMAILPELLSGTYK
jgi:hypothetical protein